MAATRYKIKVNSNKAYRDVRDLLRAKHVQIFVASEKRHMISTARISSTLMSEIKEHGATISEERIYDLDARKQA